MAEAADDQLIRLESGRSREELAALLIHEADRTPDMVVGLDFAFSFPAWFLQTRGWNSATDVWDSVSREGEVWLGTCSWPFWGRPGKRKPSGLSQEFRQTDLNVPSISVIRPKSVFQIGGAGAVGTGSIRGMPILKRLNDHGFSIWPFTDITPPGVVEIYPRVLTQAVNKSQRVDRERYLKERFPDCSRLIDEAASSEDAFDAAVSALVMSRHVDTLTALRATPDSLLRLEGAIWSPNGEPFPSEDSNLKCAHD